ncbi:pre-mRNA-processing factor 39 [Hyaloraphidium curvatum]|nr:pre-mRNA-processing factor 39 [Hyaloraphidium curvatum]
MAAAASDAAKDGDAGKAEWDKLWDAVTADPQDFASWESLIRVSENSEGGGVRKNSPAHVVSGLRTAYDHFLTKYPLLFGYWKKYADHEVTIDGLTKGDEIYERGVTSIHNSVDLWVHYLNHRTTNYPTEEETNRMLFERAAAAAGLDFLAHPLWDAYLAFEEGHKRPELAFALLERIIRIPLHQYARFFEKYSQMSVTRPVEELVSPEDYSRIYEEVQKELSGKSAQEMDQALRQKIHALKSEIYMKTQEAVMKRWVYEGEVKRPYFHVKPLDDAQLENWRKYLFFEEGEGDISRTYALYERCLVACASYEEFWLRYAKYCIALHDMDRAQNVLYRACSIFVNPTRPAVRHLYAAFEESQGRADSAKAILDTLLTSLPHHAETVVRLAYLEARRAGPDTGIAVLDRELAGMPQDDANGRSLLVSQKARILAYHSRDTKGARETYKDNVEACKGCKYFWASWMSLELAQTGETATADVGAFFESMKSLATIPEDDKRDFAQRYLDFLMERGNDMASFVAITASAEKDIAGSAGGSASRKRKAEDDAGGASKAAKAEGNGVGAANPWGAH